jgi:hypothetical protein
MVGAAIAPVRQRIAAAFPHHLAPTRWTDLPGANTA